MQRLRKRQMLKAHDEGQKEVDNGICYLGSDSNIYIFDGELPPRLYAEVIPVIKKRKRKKGIDRGTILQFSITCAPDHKFTD